MTRDQLALAQHLHGVALDSGRLADRLDPKRTGAGSMVGALDSLATIAGRAFWDLAGRPADQVSLVELNTNHPADLARDREPGT